ncbi:hypothetical protein BBJ41_36830 [Burkholderia stabilis]|nr:hypothetical protein BBJ41_36830 [Burkholderia stabilis]
MTSNGRHSIYYAELPRANNGLDFSCYSQFLFCILQMELNCCIRDAEVERKIGGGLSCRAQFQNLDFTRGKMFEIISCLSFVDQIL